MADQKLEFLLAPLRIIEKFRGESAPRDYWSATDHVFSVLFFSVLSICLFLSFPLFLLLAPRMSALTLGQEVNRWLAHEIRYKFEILERCLAQKLLGGVTWLAYLSANNTNNKLNAPQNLLIV